MKKIEAIIRKTRFESVKEALFNAANILMKNFIDFMLGSLEALRWDPSFENVNDPSGRAVRDVHNNGL